MVVATDDDGDIAMALAMMRIESSSAVCLLRLQKAWSFLRVNGRRLFSLCTGLLLLSKVSQKLRPLPHSIDTSAGLEMPSSTAISADC